MTFFIYSRKSVDTGKGESVENQIEMCRQYIKAKFPGTKDEDCVIFEDEGFSAKNTCRPQFQKMLRQMKTNKPDFLVCYRLDRISRNVSDFAALVEHLNQRGIAFLCIREEFDTSKPMGKAMMYIASVFAQLERETIAERVRDNMLMLARSGRWLGGTAPTGYTSEKTQDIFIDGKIKTACKLKECTAELQTVKLIFRKFLAYKSLSGVSKDLMRQGIASRNGKYFTPTGLKALLQNPVYCAADKAALDYFSARHADVCFSEQDCSGQHGLLAYNKRDYRKKHAPRQSMEKWIIAVGRHKGLVPGEDWVTVQQILQNNRPTGNRPANSHNGYALLSGLIYCGNCGRRMFAKKRSGTGREGLFDYLCSGKLHGGTSLCSCQNLGGVETDKAIWTHLLPYWTKSAAVIPLLQRLAYALRQEAKQESAAKQADPMRQYQTELNTLLRSLSHGNLDESIFRRAGGLLASLENKWILSRENQDLGQAPDDGTSDSKSGQPPLVAKLAKWENAFTTAPIAAKQYLLRQTVRRIIWDGDELQLYAGKP